MAAHTHEFVENYDGLVGFGMDADTDRATLMVYLQKFSDDRLLEVMTRRMEDGEIESLFETIANLLKKHLKDDEYHTLFLKEDSHH